MKNRQNTELYYPIKGKLEKVEEYLVKILTGDDDFIARTVPQIINAGGKRLRPALLLLCAKTCNYEGDKDIYYAAIIELIHTASLIHDDIIDNDTLRRGAPTINSQWGDKISIILGDYLHSLVFKLLAENNMVIMQNIATTTNRMAKGDLLQIKSKHAINLSEEQYLSINADKTASLFSCACKIGALLNGNSGDHIEALANFGEYLGLAFQIADDLLDLTADQKVLGKPLGSDIREGKLTLPVIKTLQKAKESDKAWIGNTLRSTELSRADLDQVLEMVKFYGGIEYSINKAQEYIKLCKQSIQLFPNSQNIEFLHLFADYAIERVS